MSPTSAPDGRIVRRVRGREDAAPPRRWPFTMPAVRQVLTDGLDLGAGVTVLVGENGSGKSTLLESIATAYGLNPEGGSLQTRHSTRSTEGDLAEWLVLERGPRRPRWAYFLRAETMHGLYTYLEERPGRTPETRYHELSHGESFLAVLREKFADPGFFCMDEPEAALSFRSTIALIAELDRLRREGSQVVVATHSPLLAALPGATLVELGDHGARRVAYEDLELVASWRGFLDAPERYLRHLVHG